MFSALRGLVGRADATLPYDPIEGEEKVKVGRLWSYCKGKSKSDGSEVTLFYMDAANAQPDELAAAKNAVRRNKMLRHPNFVRYIDSVEGETKIILATEPVVPLSKALDDNRNELAVSWGIHQIAKGIEFLVERSMVHGQIQLSSIFVDKAGEWKLGGLELLTAETDTEEVTTYTPDGKYAPPETRTGNTKPGKKWAADMWGLGCLIWEVYNNELPRAESLRDVDNIPETLLEPFVKLISANPRSRPSPTSFLSEAKNQGNYLQNEFVDSNLFLDELAIKDKDATAAFYGKLPSMLDKFPQVACVHKYLPKLLEAFLYGGAGSAVLAPLFKIGKLLSYDEYQKQIIPCVVKLFSSTDRATRINLLQQLSLFVEYLSAETVNNQIFPHVVTGFTDTVPAMREQTVKSMLLLAPKLNETIIDQQLLRHFAKLQTDEQAGIRTNTTVCLGKIAGYLSHATRQRILVSAFGRACRDPFPAARIAGLMAFSQTSTYFSAKEIATKVLPGVVSLTVDPDSNVREKALSLCRGLLSEIEKDPEKEADTSTEAGDQQTSAALKSWSGWATSAVSGLASVTSSVAKYGGTPAGKDKREAKQDETDEEDEDDEFEDAVDNHPSDKKKSPSRGTKKLELRAKKITPAVNKFAPKKLSDEELGITSSKDGDDSGDGDGWGSDSDKSDWGDIDGGDGWGNGKDESKQRKSSDTRVSSPPKKKSDDNWGDDWGASSSKPSIPQASKAETPVSSSLKPKLTLAERKAARDARKAERLARNADKPTIRKSGLGAVKKCD
eukprot:m.54695 g.54695  ORF g.54695 m.54695 type:complete len:783 (+) comp10943_c0_seq1:194-2542(+)